MAFHFFLSLIPLLVVIGYLLGMLVRQRGIDAFIEPILEAAPGIATDVVKRELERLAGSNTSRLAPLAVAGFLWVAASGTHGLMNVFESMFGVRRRPWWKKRLIAIAWVAVTISAFCLSTWAVLRADAALHASNRWELVPIAASSAYTSTAPIGSELAPVRASGDRPSASPSARRPIVPPGMKRRAVRLLRAPWERGAAIVVVLILGVCGVASFYRFAIQHPKGIVRRAWPGAFVAVLTWLLISWCFGAYVTSLSSYALFYGSLAAVAVLLFWCYLTGLALLLGAEVNAQLEGVRDT